MKALKFLIAGAVFIGAVLFFASPYWVLYQMNQAYQRNDAAGISKYINFPQVKSSLKPQIQQRMDAGAGLAHLPESLQKWGSQLSMAVSDHAVDALVNEHTILLLMQGKELKEAIGLNALLPTDGYQELKSRSSPPTAAAPLFEPPLSSKQPAQVNNAPQLKAHYVSWNRFKIAVPTASGNLTCFEMIRTGLSWKITSVELPN